MLRRLPGFSRLRRLAKWARRRYRQAVRPRIVRARGVRLVVEPWYGEELANAIYADQYETAESALIPRTLSPEDRVLEIGTGLGFASTLCARICGSGKVMTCEANPRMIPLIREVYHLNGVSPALCGCLVSRESGPRRFFVANRFWSSSTYDRGLEGEELELPARAFEELVEEFRPTYLLMDMEGSESDLVGLPIASHVRNVLIELHSHVTGEEGAEKVRSWLATEGFRIVTDHGNRSVVHFTRTSS